MVEIEHLSTLKIMLNVTNLSKTLEQKKILTSVDLTVKEGQVIAITGPSGSGKTTLLNLLLGVSEPDGGQILLDGIEYSNLSEGKRRKFRLNNIGIVDQNNSLIDEISCKQNIELVARMAQGRRKADIISSKILSALRMAEYAERMPFNLSGGERQRINIACALANHPKMLVADEPTSSLDDESAATVMKAFQGIARKNNAVVIIVTHDYRVKKYADKAYDIRELDNGSQYYDN